MRVTIERMAKMKKKWFSSEMKPAGYDVVSVTLLFSEEENELIKRNNLQDYEVYHSRMDDERYQEYEESRVTHPEGFLASHPPKPIYSKFVKDFLKEGNQEIYSQTALGDMGFIEIEKKVEKNLRELKQLLAGIAQHPTGKKTLDI